MSLLDNVVVNKDLTPELAKRKAELAWGLDLELDRINLNAGLAWTAKQKQSAEAQQRYVDTWEQELTDAGYVVHPMFESLEKVVFEDWYEELNKINNRILVIINVFVKEMVSIFSFSIWRSSSA